MRSHDYQTDLSDAEWAWKHSAPSPPESRRERPRTHHQPDILDAVFLFFFCRRLLVARSSGRAWLLLLPHDLFPPWKERIYHYSRSWR